MELRSRSRSKTPFQTQNFIESESFEGSNHVSVTTRSSTRRSARTIVSGGAHEEFYTTTKPVAKTKSTKSLRNIVSAFKTSDYSSEEDSLSHISENEKNQIIEDAKAAANGTAEISALNLYRKAGRYWDKYPKTDYTYSPHSRDRVEIAPGVVQMPNMSRRTIHSHDSGTNTDIYFERYASKSAKQRLFSSPNNNREEDREESFKINRVSTRSRTRSFFTSVFVSFYSAIYWCFYSLYEVLNSTTIWLLKKLHHLTSHVMYLDNWLMKKSNGGKRTKAVITLCLLPLLIFAGLHVLLASGVSLAPFCHPHCGSYISTYYNSFIKTASNLFK